MLNLPGKLCLPSTKYAVLAAFVSWLYLHISQVLQAQVATDQKVVGLLTTLEIIYSFVNVIETDVSNKIRVLEDIIKKIFYRQSSVLYSSVNTPVTGFRVWTPVLRQWPGHLLIFFSENWSRDVLRCHCHY